MTGSFDRVILWLPRLVGIGLCLFLAAFALDAFSDPASPGTVLLNFAIHLLPAFILATAVAVAWRRPWLGAVAFLSLAVAYALMAHRLDWILVISVPLCVVGLLFLGSWWRGLPAPR